jgi:hypothetical protein
MLPEVSSNFPQFIQTLACYFKKTNTTSFHILLVYNLISRCQLQVYDTQLFKVLMNKSERSTFFLKIAALISFRHFKYLLFYNAKITEPLRSCPDNQIDSSIKIHINKTNNKLINKIRSSQIARHNNSA